MGLCAICSSEIAIRLGRGRQPKTCSDACKKESAKRSAIAARASFKKCSIEGCDRLANRTGAGLCETHYYRQRRNGTTDLKVLGNEGDLEHSHGYVLRRANGHPMALGGSRAYLHRMVYYDAHGDGPFACHWCSKLVTWDDLHIDHVNEDKKDNRLDNLVASCCRCNTGRSMDKKKAKLARKNGIEFMGEVHTLNAWAGKLGISRMALVTRLKNGWSLERALTQTRGKTGPRPKIGIDGYPVE